MSGTKEKATGKQSAKGRTGKVPAPEVAQVDASHASGPELSVTLPGHYVAVGASSVNVEPGRVDASLTPESLSSDAESSALNMNATALPHTDDVQVLEVRAISERGFWRCGRFWPRQPVHVFVSDDPEGDNEVNALEGDVVVECFISNETAGRLKAEPNLKVTVLQPVEEEE
ncbi:TPA: hypothetical protein MJA79_15450 [Klebsiella pneumoniae]|uniref:Uncharacterized protein n=2 Tax=Klebsiella pneumoniae TaxID=573 RepID=A0A378BZV0_KLEPO|nr:hypothetical protein [Klebsiella pneumoniae]STV56553.1 Uncharacterised protein [Klebsiella pneumoniae subsp. ozaenae]VFS20599.1 Uncharacterised protein [Serratia liquefaciens]SQC19670.1 Uncharacterised protein [Klebsiella pneumoniae]STR96354.1 Uncharacterised protein [Klebsiella pneumoniae]STT58443.1 Uncharacterised protein [Klebsiella pneumoniae]